MHHRAPAAARIRQGSTPPPTPLPGAGAESKRSTTTGDVSSCVLASAATCCLLEHARDQGLLAGAASMGMAMPSTTVRAARDSGCARPEPPRGRGHGGPPWRARVRDQNSSDPGAAEGWGSAATTGQRGELEFIHGGGRGRWLLLQRERERPGRKEKIGAARGAPAA
ncbi:hypothetical protein ACQJBY_013442 [Aegilops geniculata]